MAGRVTPIKDEWYWIRGRALNPAEPTVKTIGRYVVLSGRGDFWWCEGRYHAADADVEVIQRIPRPKG